VICRVHRFIGYVADTDGSRAQVTSFISNEPSSPVLVALPVFSKTTVAPTRARPIVYRKHGLLILVALAIVAQNSSGNRICKSLFIAV
jgi:hypothetical protein